jgi:uncharacterized protein (DUF433 family)
MRQEDGMALVFVPEAVPLATDSDGVVRVGGTRVTLDTVLHFFNEGATAEEIAYKFPTLDLADIYAVVSYYLRHRPVVDEYLRQREQQAAEVRRQNEARFSQVGMRERLLARRASKNS